jgi:hypothetical protein
MVAEAVLVGSAWEMSMRVTVLPLMGMAAGAV